MKRKEKNLHQLSCKISKKLHKNETQSNVVSQASIHFMNKQFISKPTFQKLQNENLCANIDTNSYKTTKGKNQMVLNSTGIKLREAKIKGEKRPYLRWAKWNREPLAEKGIGGKRKRSKGALQSCCH